MLPGAELTFRKPYSVRATKATGTVEMKQPAMGMKEQIKTNRDSRPIPGIARAHIPAAVKAVFTRAIRACTHAGLCPFLIWQTESCKQEQK